MERKTILIVDDEWNMRNLLKIHLSNEYKILEAASGKEAISLVNTSDIDVVVLDIMMPDMDGWEVCKRVREWSQVPVLMLTARGDIKDKVQGFQCGADDYLVKPFELEELSVRIQALLRRFLHSNDYKENQTIKVNDLLINKETREIEVNSVPVEFTPKEFDLLLLLVSHPKKVFTREHLLDQIWDRNEVLDIRTVDTHIKNMRVKLRRANLSFHPVKTVWGLGYKFEGPDE
jgi:two-component system, OmpR family, response regulator ResD